MDNITYNVSNNSKCQKLMFISFGFDIFWKFAKRSIDIITRMVCVYRLGNNRLGNNRLGYLLKQLKKRLLENIPIGLWLSISSAPSTVFC